MRENECEREKDTNGDKENVSKKEVRQKDRVRHKIQEYRQWLNVFEKEIESDGWKEKCVRQRQIDRSRER